VLVHQTSRNIRNFWAKVQKGKTCWLWLGSPKGVNRYGQFAINRKIYSAHRVSYMMHFGEIPEGMCILHTCNNKRCVNPSHIRLGTQIDNMTSAAEDKLFHNHNKNKTHCSNGHEYTNSNTYWYKGSRCCRTCNRISSTKYKLKEGQRANSIDK
jgi:hypothetical protein